MKIYKVEDYAQLSQAAAKLIAAQIEQKPNSILGLATGASPEGVYQQLVKKHQKGTLDFSRVCTFNLDEYKGLPRENAQSYYYYMFDHLFSRVNIPPEQVHLPDGMAGDDAAHYDQLIEQAGGIDLQLLGIGQNGHIGFNEPDDHFAKQTHLVTLTKSTLDANAKYFESQDEMPRKAITMGIGTIMKARKILLIANGSSKKAAITKMLQGEVTPQVPASILQFHPDVTVIADGEALAGI